VGTGRSGTTLLRLMINAHPRIYLTQEASFYLATTGLSGRHNNREILHRYFRSAAFAWLKLERTAVLDMLPGDTDKLRLPDAFTAVMRSKARQYGKERYGDKTPLHFAYLGRIFKEFEDPRIIHMVRDPRGTVASLMRMPWAPGSHWLNSLYCDQQLKAVAPFRKNIHEVRLEDLLEKPADSMKGVLDFIGEPWDDAVIDHQRHVPADDLPPFPWFQRSRSNPKPRQGPPAWIHQLKPAWIRLVERMNAYGMKKYKYSPVPLDREPGSLARALAVLSETFKIFKSVRRLRRVAGMHRRKKPPDPQAAMQALLNVNPRAWSYYPGFQIPQVPAVD
jgi:hypothetical protein